MPPMCEREVPQWLPGIPGFVTASPVCSCWQARHQQPRPRSCGVRCHHWRSVASTRPAWWWVRSSTSSAGAAASRRRPRWTSTTRPLPRGRPDHRCPRHGGSPRPRPWAHGSTSGTATVERARPLNGCWSLRPPPTPGRWAPRCPRPESPPPQRCSTTRSTSSAVSAAPHAARPKHAWTFMTRRPIPGRPRRLCPPRVFSRRRPHSTASCMSSAATASGRP